MKRFDVLLVLAVTSAALGCSEQQNFANGCEKTEQCPIGTMCRIRGNDTVGVCVCVSDDACGEGEKCNSQGVCQLDTGCRTTADCAEEPNTFCDVASGDCIALTACGQDVHCDAGFVCDLQAGGCVPGCYDHGDCPLYAACNRPGQPVGACLMGTCGDKSFCPYGHVCNAGVCTPHPNQNNCLPCGGVQRCPSPLDFCLVNNLYDPTKPETAPENFCSIECTGDESCPNGYNCNGIVVPTQSACTNDADCGPGSQCRLGEGALRGWCSCRSDQECSPSELPPSCQKSCSGLGITPCETDNDCLGRCLATCLSPQGQACTDDSQCAPTPLCDNGTCITNGRGCTTGAECLCNINGQCINSGRPCTTSADCGLTCQDGGCLIGAGCAPTEGLLCSDVR